MAVGMVVVNSILCFLAAVSMTVGTLALNLMASGLAVGLHNDVPQDFSGHTLESSILKTFSFLKRK